MGLSPLHAALLCWVTLFADRRVGVHEPRLLEEFKDTVITANVEVTEMMGSETYLFLDVNGCKMTGRVAPTTTAKPGDTIQVALDLSKLHLFDIDTEETIIN